MSGHGVFKINGFDLTPGGGLDPATRPAALALTFFDLGRGVTPTNLGTLNTSRWKNPWNFLAVEIEIRSVRLVHGLTPISEEACGGIHSRNKRLSSRMIL